MKIIAKLIFLLFLSFQLASCALMGENTNNDVQQTDIETGEETTFYSSRVEAGLLAEGPSHYYHIAGNYLYSIAKDDLSVAVLDNNPDTLDDAEVELELMKLSNAYFSMPESVNYDKGKLYVHAHSEEEDQEGEIQTIDTLYEADPSGGRQRILYKSFTPIMEMFVHDGFAYLSTSEELNAQKDYRDGLVSEEELVEMKKQVSRFPINNPEQVEIIYEELAEGTLYTDMYVYDDYLYFTTLGVTDGFEVNSGEKVSPQCIVINLETLESKKINSIFLYPQDGYQLGIRTEPERHENFQSKEESLRYTGYLQAYEKNGEFIEEWPVPEDAFDFGLMLGYGQYYAKDNLPFSIMGLEDKRLLQINDNKGNVLAEVAVPKNFDIPMAMDKRYIYYRAYAEGQYMEVHRLDLERVGEEDLAFEPLFTYQAPTYIP